jgi:hypothetical protein
MFTLAFFALLRIGEMSILKTANHTISVNDIRKTCPYKSVSKALQTLCFPIEFNFKTSEKQTDMSSQGIARLCRITSYKTGFIFS